MTGIHHHARLGVISLGLAIGITWAFFVFMLGFMATFFGWGAPLAQMLSSVYVGFTPTMGGTFAGAAWGFAEGFIAGAMIAWLYNRFQLTRRAPLRRREKESDSDSDADGGDEDR